MPIRKYRDVSEMEGNTWKEPGSPELMRAIRSTWDFAQRTLQPKFPPGVYKYRSIEEMKAQRDRWAQANFEAYQERLRQERSKLKSQTYE